MSEFQDALKKLFCITFFIKATQAAWEVENYEFWILVKHKIYKKDEFSYYQLAGGTKEIELTTDSKPLLKVVNYQLIIFTCCTESLRLFITDDEILKLFRCSSHSIGWRRRTYVFCEIIPFIFISNVLSILTEYVFKIYEISLYVYRKNMRQCERQSIYHFVQIVDFWAKAIIR